MEIPARYQVESHRPGLADSRQQGCRTELYAQLGELALEVDESLYSPAKSSEVGLEASGVVEPSKLLVRQTTVVPEIGQHGSGSTN